MVANKHTADAIRDWANAQGPGRRTVFAAPRFVKWLYKTYSTSTPVRGLAKAATVSTNADVLTRIEALNHCAKFDTGTYIFTKFTSDDVGRVRIVGAHEAKHGFIVEADERNQKSLLFTEVVHHLTDPVRAQNLHIFVINSEALIWMFDDPNLAFEFKMTFGVG